MLDKSIVTIPKNLIKEGELILMPRKEYEEYLFFKKAVPIGKMTRSEKKAITEGRRQIKSGKYITPKEPHAVLEN